MRLSALEPTFRRHAPGALGKAEGMADAQGILFLCPACVNKDGHSLLVWFADRGVPAEALPAPRWKATGTTFEDLSLSPSVNAGCWHGFVTNGEIT